MSSEAGGEQYYCYQCRAACTPTTPDFVCPTCNEGFIEPMAHQQQQRPRPILRQMMGGSDPISAMMHHRRMRQQQGQQQDGSSAPAPPPADPSEDEEPPVPPVPPGLMGPSHTGAGGPDILMLQNLIQSAVHSAAAHRIPNTPHQGTPSQPDGGEPGEQEVGGRRHFHRVHSSSVPLTGGPFPRMFQGGGGFPVRIMTPDGRSIDPSTTDIPSLFSMILSDMRPGGGQSMYGNPGDYAWGPTGLDNIISQLIGQLDGAGPPPAQATSIESLPDVKVSQALVDNETDCSVCQEFFVLEEEVKKLPCEHHFHSGCIVPWLKLHNSCPICRVSIDGTDHPPADTPMADDMDPIPSATPPPPPPVSTAPPPSYPAAPQNLHEDDLD